MRDSGVQADFKEATEIKLLVSFGLVSVMFSTAASISAVLTYHRSRTHRTLVTNFIDNPHQMPANLIKKPHLLMHPSLSGFKTDDMHI